MNGEEKWLKFSSRGGPCGIWVDDSGTHTIEMKTSPQWRERLWQAMRIAEVVIRVGEASVTRLFRVAPRRPLLDKFTDLIKF